MSETRTDGLPSVEEVARVLHDLSECDCGESMPCDGENYGYDFGIDAQRVLALFGAAVPRIRAEALREAAGDAFADGLAFTSQWLSGRL